MAVEMIRPHGTRGAYMVLCPACDHSWECPVRWHGRAQEWRVLDVDTAFCPECWERYAMPVLGRRVRRESEMPAPSACAINRIAYRLRWGGGMAIKERLVRDGVAQGFRALAAENDWSVAAAIKAGVERAFFDWLDANREALLEKIAAGVAGD